MPLIVVADDPDVPGGSLLVEVDDGGVPTGGVQRVPAPGGLAEAVGRRESAAAARGEHVRWVWDDTARRYPALLAAGVRVERCHDLRLCHAVLRRSVRSAASELARAPEGPWDRWRAPGGGHGAVTERPDADGAPSSGLVLESLFELDAPVEPDRPTDVVDELRRQLAAVAGSAEPWRLRLLCAAESTGALIAAEMHHDGLPWSVEVHDRLLTEALGPRPAEGSRPERLEALAVEVRTVLGRPGLNPDSQQDLLGAMRSAGLPVTSTRKWEIEQLDHPVREPLLEYKRLARLLSANGWAWMDQWVVGGRYRPEYVPAGVVTGRWASSGGGALQLPAVVRGAVVADPGWRLVVADAAQLEPRVLAAMAGDRAMAQAGRHADLYEGLVSAGVVESRRDAKYAMLGAIYGATTGQSGALVPRLTAAFPEALGLVERAARAGERGEVVTTWLGRTSPLPGEAMLEGLRAAASEGADAEAVRAVRRRARDWGRFTRNFVVQGTAAEWALCWMASLRRRLREMGAAEVGAAGSSAPGGREVGPHLVFFLHDEVVVHAPEGVADRVAEAVREAAQEAGRLLFGDAPVEFPLDVAVVRSYDEAG